MTRSTFSPRGPAVLATGVALALTLGAAPAATPVQAGVTLADPQAFQQECSACHMAYPAWLLPRASWKRIMATLDNHFGEDASLDDKTRAAIEAYLVKSAADRNGRKPRWMNALKPGDVPLRISELPWFRREHGARLIARARANPRIGTISACNACHRGAEQGRFEDD